MGNCCRTTSSMEWAGDHWDSLSSKHKRTSSSKVFDENHHDLSSWNLEKKQLLGALRASFDANGKVKIKISKKELEELLGLGGTGIEKQKEEEGRISAEQVLVGLINARDQAHHRPWRPALQSIPEVN